MATRKFDDPLQVQVARERMLKERRDDLVVMIVRNPEICAEARLVLKPEHFHLAGESPHQIILRHLYTLLDSNLYKMGDVPYAALYDAIAETLTGYTDEELKASWVGEMLNNPEEPGWELLPPGLLYQCYKKDLTKYNKSYGYQTLRLFMEERAVADRATTLVKSMDGRVPVGYSTLLHAMAADAVRIESIGDKAIALPFPLEWDLNPIVVFPTGCTWIDNILGGQAVGDVNGLIGVFAGGKTTAMTQIIVMTGKYFLEQGISNNKKPKIAVFVSYEETLKTIQPRVWSCSARVSKEKLERMKSLDELTRRGHLADYEIELYRASGHEDYSQLDGEYERMMLAQSEINQCVRLIDMRKEGRGHGWVDELSGYLTRFQEEENVEIGLVCLDYVNAMCRRHVRYKNEDMNKMLRHYVGETPLQVEEKIAAKFQCPVWLAQQFSGEANKKSPTAKMVMADASEARSFGENLVFCVAFGTTDPSTYTTQVHYVKTRRGGKQGATGIVRIDGDLARITSADHLYMAQGNKIVEKRIVAQFTGATVASPHIIKLHGEQLSSWAGG